MIGDLINIKIEDLPSRRARKKPLHRRKWIKKLLLGCVLLAICGYIAAHIYLKPYREEAETYDLAVLNKLEESSVVYDRNSKELGRLSSENIQLVAFAEIPSHFIDALIATEDSRFYKHHGVDWWGVGRAVYQYVLKGGNRQGASSITQQLARNAYARRENTLDRKIFEAFLAMRIEKHYNGNKNQILELYLNRIWFGSQYYGLGAAAQGYFRKTVSALTLEDSAILVGLIKNPRLYSPLKPENREYTLRERNEVYDRMVITSKLTKAKASELRIKPLDINLSGNSLSFNYLQSEVQNEVDSILKKQGFEGDAGKGFKFYTSVDTSIQQAAEKSMRTRLSEIEALAEYPKTDVRETPATFAVRVAANPSGKALQPGYLQGASLVIDNKTGAVLSMVGGRNFKESQFNRVNLSKRPAGTVFTPFVYAAAFEGQYFPGSRIQDEPMDNTRVMIGATTGTLGEWGMEASGVHQGEISLRQALVEGKNNCVARLGLEIGVDKVKDFGKRAGLGELPGEPSMLLGRGELSVNELCLAYTTFANAGVRPASTFLITRIETSAGQTIYTRRASDDQPVKVTDPITAWMVHSCLDDALAIGTGEAAKSQYGLKPFPASGKTGTHSRSTDLWFAGYSNAVTCVVWAGLDRKDTVYPDAFSNRVALPIWTDIMNASQENFPGADFVPPVDIKDVELCEISGKLATYACLEDRPDPADPTRLKRFKSAYLEYIRPGYRINESCDFHSNSSQGEPLLQNPDPPMIFAPAPGGVGVPLDNEEATPVLLQSTTVDGKDPYESNFGIGVISADPNKPPKAIIIKEEDTATPLAPAVPAYKAGADPILIPLPGPATVDE